jgi:hypothetical protein
MKLRQLALTSTFAVLVLPLACLTAFAERCAVISGPRYNLTMETVDWSIKVDSGHSCIRGIRYANVAFEDLTLITPPQSGRVDLHGWGFRYTAKEDFRGQDSFEVGVSGKIKKIFGTSKIRILVTVSASEVPERR